MKRYSFTEKKVSIFWFFVSIKKMSPKMLYFFCYWYMGICVLIEDKEGTLSVSYILYS